MNFANNVYRIMEAKKMKQSAVARAAGMDPKSFNALLRGKKRLQGEHVLLIAEALECTPNDLFTPDSIYKLS